MARRSDAPPPGSDPGRDIDRLFRLPLDEFVAARNQLATSLRSAGQVQDAAAVKALAKPSVTAWAVNQVWWTDRRAFEAMLDAGTRLRDAQRASLEGRAGRVRDAGNLRDAVEARQEAITAVVELAVRALGGSDRVSPPMRQRIGATCDALATGDAPPGTRLGRLTHDLASAGFGALSGMLSIAAAARVPSRAPRDDRPPASVMPFRPRPATPEPPGRREHESPSDRRRREAEERTRATEAKAREALEQATRVVRDAEGAVAERREAVDVAEGAHAAARERVAAAEQELEAARQAESNARVAAAAAKRDAAAAEVELTRARRAAGKLRAQAGPAGG